MKQRTAGCRSAMPLMVLLAAAAALPRLTAAQSLYSPGLTQEQVRGWLPGPLLIAHSMVHIVSSHNGTACDSPPASVLLQASQLAGFWQYQNRTQGGTFCFFGSVWDEMMAGAAAQGPAAINVTQVCTQMHRRGALQVAPLHANKFSPARVASLTLSLTMCCNADTGGRNGRHLLLHHRRHPHPLR